MTKTTDISTRAWGTKLTSNGQTSHDPNTTSWGDPHLTGSAYDFRTDAITTPTTSQLTALTHATLNDDVFNEDASTATFESQIAALFGRQSACFVVSCTMANQLALAALCQRNPGAILADASSHIVKYEAGGLFRAPFQPVSPKNGHHLTLDDIVENVKLEGECQWEVCPTGIVSIENTTHGNVVALTELRKMREWTATRGLAMHIDGARIWDASASGGGSLTEIAAQADTVAVAFGKGIGAPIGAMVVGDEEVVRRVKRLRQSVGGGVRKVGFLAAAAREAVRENWGDGMGVFKGVHEATRRVAEMWTERGGSLVRRVETSMVWLDLKSAGVTAGMVNELAMRRGVLVAAPRVVLHHQICGKALAALEQVFEDVLVRKQVCVGRSAVGKGCGQAGQ
ncbi:hypothetical protein OQA88_13068 [Cercophora sp. LCS_1]